MKSVAAINNERRAEIPENVTTEGGITPTPPNLDVPVGYVKSQSSAQEKADKNGKPVVINPPKSTSVDTDVQFSKTNEPKRSTRCHCRVHILNSHGRKNKTSVALSLISRARIATALFRHYLTPSITSRKR